MSAPDLRARLLEVAVELYGPAYNGSPTDSLFAMVVGTMDAYARALEELEGYDRAMAVESLAGGVDDYLNEWGAA